MSSAAIRSLVPAALAAALASPARAQIPAHDAGPMLHVPAVFSVDAQTPRSSAADGLQKRTGFHGLNDVPPVLNGNGPDFAGSKIFAACTPRLHNLPDIDAMSLGLDVIQADTQGLVSIPRDHWTALVFSVRKGTRGRPGEILRDELGRPGGNSADFFDYVFRGSSCVPPAFIDRPSKDADSTEIWLPAGADVDAVDVYSALYERGLALFTHLPPRPTLYFSVSKATIDRVPASVWGSTQNKSGATILKTTWTGSGWSCPAVAYGPAALGLAACEDIDALAINVADAGTTVNKIVLSTTPAGPGCPQRNPVLLVVPGSRPTVQTLRYGPGLQGDPVSTRIGLDPSRTGDDVDGICILDPTCATRSDKSTPIEQAFGSAHGDPRSWLQVIFSGFGLRRTLEVQAHRHRDPRSRTERYDAALIGGQPGAVGVWIFSLPVPKPPLLPLDPTFKIPMKSAYLGHPTTFMLPIPLQAPPGKVLRSWDFTVYAATVRGYDIRVSYPLRIRGHR